MHRKYKYTLLSIAGLLLALAAGGCATGPGSALECPSCDNVTELLVGDQCVPIEQVEPCGPDGHAHGDGCHCFSGQQPTTIAESDYCLQPGCAHDDHDDHDPHEDHDHQLASSGAVIYTSEP